MKAFLSIAVKLAPNQFVGNYDKNAHHRNTADDHRGIPLLGNLGYVGTETVCPQSSVTPGSEFGDNTGVPRSPGRRASTSHPEGKYPRKNKDPPYGPAAQAVRFSCFPEVIRNGHGPGYHVKQNVPLSAHRDQQNAAPIDSNVGRNEKADHKGEGHIDRE